MASSATRPGKAKPLSSHPLFPAMFALWFGALLGLGSLAIRPALIEGLVLQAGIDRLIPAAAPPLGTTARGLLALLLAAAGAGLGALFAVRLRRQPGRASAQAATGRQPLSAHAELGDTLDSLGPPAPRRWPLAMNRAEPPFAAVNPGPPPAPALVASDEPLDLGEFPLPEVQPQPAIEAQPRTQRADPDLCLTPPSAPVEAEAPPAPEPKAAPQPDIAGADLPELARRIQASMALRRAKRLTEQTNSLAAPVGAHLDPPFSEPISQPLNQPFNQPLPREAEPGEPVVIFASQMAAPALPPRPFDGPPLAEPAPAAPAEAQQALRAALIKLQGIGSAA